MRMLSETKLAIDDLYERIKDQNKNRVLSTGKDEAGPEPTADYGNSLKTDTRSWLEKLSALQFRVLDLNDITTQFEAEIPKKIGLKLPRPKASIINQNLL